MADGVSNEYLYRVTSIETIESDRVTRFARLKAVAEERPDRTYPVELCLTLDGVRPGDLIRLTAKRLTRLHFLHHYDRKNQGDVLSGPYHYFPFDIQQEKISWDKQIIGKTSIPVSEGDTIIMGGGIYFAKDKPRFDEIAKKAKFLIGWGMGIDPRIDSVKFIEKFSLIGTRERNIEYIDDERVMYVPCASCMNKAFDDMEDTKVDKDVVLHINGGFNSSSILKAFKSVRTTTTVDPFTDILKNLKRANCVVTNSYHGAYWASLLGKKVICIKTDVPKWDGLHENVLFSRLDDIEKLTKAAQRVPSEYLMECRSINRAFFEKVTALVAS